MGRGFGCVLIDDDYDWDRMDSICLGVEFGLDEASRSIQRGLWRIPYSFDLGAELHLGLEHIHAWFSGDVL